MDYHSLLAHLWAVVRHLHQRLAALEEEKGKEPVVSVPPLPEVR